MAIGTLGAIALGVGAIGSVVGASKNSSAINKATDAQTQGNAQSMALQQNIYNQNQAALQPWQTGGLSAFGQTNAMLGLPAAQPQQGLAQYGMPIGVGAYDGNFDFGGMGENFGWTGRRNPPNAMSLAPANPGQGFANYLANSDYGFQMQRGGNAINSGYAGSGTLKSGAAMKGLEEFRQGLQQGYRGEYMDRLNQQQQMGLGAASAQAGVGQTFANNMTSLNAANGNILAQSALAKANNTNSLIGGLTGLTGWAAGRYG